MNKIKIIIYTIAISCINSITYAGGESVGYIRNPLTGVETAEGVVTVILRLVTNIGSVVAVMFLIYSGFLFVKARGNSGELEKARSTFFWTIIGIAVLLGAYVISTVVVGTVNSISGS